MIPLHPHSGEAGGTVPILAWLGLGSNWSPRPAERVGSETAATVGTVGTQHYSPAERRILLNLAREALAQTVAGAQVRPVEEREIGQNLRQPRGCFVTLTVGGHLRGCVGHVFPLRPLYVAVMENAQGAAVLDPRFDLVQREELPEIQIEISVLTTPQPLPYRSSEDLLNQLQPCRDGVVLRLGERSATYLPQVWTRIADKVRFLDSLSEKAGSRPGAWRDAGARVFTYQAEHFAEGFQANPSQAK